MGHVGWLLGPAVLSGLCWSCYPRLISNCHHKKELSNASQLLENLYSYKNASKNADASTDSKVLH